MGKNRVGMALSLNCSEKKKTQKKMREQRQLIANCKLSMDVAIVTANSGGCPSQESGHERIFQDD